MIEIETKREYLPGLLDKTRKSRIEAERRLLKLDALAKHACVYYACATTLLSLSTLFFDYKGLPFLSISAAIVVTVCTVYASAQNYGVRAEQMKECYLELQELHLSPDGGCLSDDREAEDLVNRIGERYVAIIRQTENHLSRDYEIAFGQTSALKEGIRWFGLRCVVYVLPAVIAICFSLSVWPL